MNCIGNLEFLTGQSNGLVVANDFMTVLAAMLLVVASGDAEWDKATSEPASTDSENEAEDPCQHSLGLIARCDTVFAAELTGNRLRRVLEGAHLHHRCLLNNNLLLRLRLNHLGLLHHWLLLHGLLLHGLLLHGLLLHGLLHGLLLHGQLLHWLHGWLLDKGLLLLRGGVGIHTSIKVFF